MYQIDPSGAYYEWKAAAIGKSMKNAKSFLEKRYNSEMNLEDAINITLLTMKEGFEGSMSENNIEVGIIQEDHVFRLLSKQEVKDYLDEIE